MLRSHRQCKKLITFDTVDVGTIIDQVASDAMRDSAAGYLYRTGRRPERALPKLTGRSEQLLEGIWGRTR